MEEITKQPPEDVQQKTEEQQATEPVTPPAPVQTSGLRTPAEPEKPKYNFSVRAGVRAFLEDCRNWKIGKADSPFFSMHYYVLPNKKRIYAYFQRAVDKDVDSIYKVIVRYFIESYYSSVPIEITKDQFEQYCAEHKNEL